MQHQPDKPTVLLGSSVYAAINDGSLRTDVARVPTTAEREAARRQLGLTPTSSAAPAEAAAAATHARAGAAAPSARAAAPPTAPAVARAPLAPAAETPPSAPAATVAPAAAPMTPEELLLSLQRRPNPKQYEYDLPNELLHAIFTYLQPEQIAACVPVCKRWEQVAGSEGLWRSLCKALWQTQHPDPFKSLPPDDDAGDADDHVAEDGEQDAAPAAVSLSLARQEVLNMKRVAREQMQAECTRLHGIRQAALSEWRQAAASIGSYRRAYLWIPCLRNTGVYALRVEYIRSGQRDIFHVVDGILKCVYHRVFYFRSDGSLLYCMLPGEVQVAIKEFRRAIKEEQANASTAAISAADNGVTPTAAATAAADDLHSLGAGEAVPHASGGAGAGAGTGATLAVRAGQHASGRVRFPQRHAHLLNHVNSVGKTGTSPVGVGWWRLEGRRVKAEVQMSSGLQTNWSLDVMSVDGGASNRLLVSELSLTELGADPGAATNLTPPDGEFVFKAVAV